ncbi:4Fe-4S dicluster domain-containing protein [Chloroflexota bacterium]
MLNVESDLLDKIKETGEFDASACMSCGCCTALCPAEVAILPRVLFRYALLGAKDKLVESTDTIFSCLLCKMCEDNCPSQVSITENIRTLRNYLNKNVLGV